MMNIQIPAGATTAQIQRALQNLHAVDSICIDGVQFSVHKLMGDSGIVFNLKSKDCIIPMFGVFVTVEQLASEVYAHLNKINRIEAGDNFEQVLWKIHRLLDMNICQDTIDGCNHMFIGEDMVSISQENRTYSFCEVDNVWFESRSDLAVCLLHHFEQQNNCKEQKQHLKCPHCGTVMERIDSECSVLMAECANFDDLITGHAFDAVDEYHCTNDACSKTIFVAA